MVEIQIGLKMKNIIKKDLKNQIESDVAKQIIIIWSINIKNFLFNLIILILKIKLFKIIKIFI